MQLDRGSTSIQPQKRWLLRAGDTQEEKTAVKEMADRLNISTVTAQLLYNRGYKNAASAERFLKMENENLCDPFDLKDVRKAVERIRLALERGEKITIYGDYDVDGVTSVCLMYLYFSSKNAQINYYIPNREGEGYGISCSALDRLKIEGTSLVITVDTGITANEEIDYAKSIGIDIVVTDHHECRSELPHATAVVNPHRPDCPYPFKELAGVGVAFKCICAYEATVTGEDLLSCVGRLGKEYADLVAIGTIADVMPLIDENKLLVSLGLERMRKNRRIGLSALMEAATQKNEGKGGSVSSNASTETKMTSSYIGFTLAPRLNAAGRIKTASLAVELFLSPTYERAQKYARELCAANAERQEEENQIMREAYEKIEREHDLQSEYVLVLDADSWHHGVIGIVASRITERYCMPCILISFKGSMENQEPSDDDIGKGSGRSVKGLNLVDALVNSSEKLVKYGGHELAAGLSIRRADLPAFRQKINEYAKDILNGERPVPVMEADCELSFSQIKTSLVQEFHCLEPYGTGNPTPLFILNNAVVYEVVSLRQGKHTKLSVGEGSNRVNAIYFSHSPEDVGVKAGDVISLLFQLDINEWCGRTTVQMIIRDLHIVSTMRHTVDKLIDEKQRFEEIKSGAFFSEEEDVVPVRDDFACVYQLIRRNIRSGQNVMTHEEIRTGILHTDKRKIGYIKLKFIIRILQEMNLLGIEEISDEVYSFRFRFLNTKVDLDKSHILKRLRAQQRA